MIFNKKRGYILLSLLATVILTACSNNSDDSKKESTTDTIHKVKESSEQIEDIQEPLDILNHLNNSYLL